MPSVGYRRGRERRLLTQPEVRIAGLVAQGLTNQEIADALHVSPKTVEWNLTKVYRVLGVRSRTELAVRWKRRDFPGASVPTSDDEEEV